MEREEAVELLVNRAAELRLDMKISNEGVCPPEILLILAWERAIVRAYQVAYDQAPLSTQHNIDAAKARCRKERSQSFINSIVKGDFSPAYVQSVKCGCCGEVKPVVDILGNAAGARPLWTYYLQSKDAI